MWFRLFVLCAFVVTVALAAEPASARPKTCAAGVTYKKDCNTCTCGATPKADKCSTFDCTRTRNSGSSTTKRPSSTARPGICPTIATPPPGNTDCSRRTQTSECKLDNECKAAKKCCKNGCGIMLCRNAIYPNTP